MPVRTMVTIGIPPVDGVTGAGEMPRFSVYVDMINGLIYINRGTKASPLWYLSGSLDRIGAPE